MKENSIEEDMKWIEKIIKKCDDCGLHECIACEICWTEVQAIQHILSDYKKLQEEFKQVDHECERLEEKEVRLIKENEQLRTEVNSVKKDNGELKDKVIDRMAEELRYQVGMQQDSLFCIDICENEKDCDMDKCKERIIKHVYKQCDNEK